MSMPCLAICAFHSKISLLFKKNVSAFSGKVFLGQGRKMSEITACDFTLEMEEFLVTVIITWWVYFLIFYFQRCILILEVLFARTWFCQLLIFLFLFTWMISLKMYYKFGLLLGEDFLSPYCEAIEDVIHGHVIYMVILTSTLSTNPIPLTHLVLVLYFKIKLVSFSRQSNPSLWSFPLH